jgi:hypothetical protein
MTKSRADHWHTRWHHETIVVSHNDDDIDRIDAAALQRVLLVCPQGGVAPGDLDLVVFELPDAHVLVRAECGIAGRIHFERQAFWTRHPVVHWLARADAPLPARLSRGVWPWRGLPHWQRLPRGDLDATLATWPVGPAQSWEERKWQLIRQAHPLAMGATPLAGQRR